MNHVWPPTEIKDMQACAAHLCMSEKPQLLRPEINQAGCGDRWPQHAGQFTPQVQRPCGESRPGLSVASEGFSGQQRAGSKGESEEEAKAKLCRALRFILWVLDFMPRETEASGKFLNNLTWSGWHLEQIPLAAVWRTDEEEESLEAKRTRGTFWLPGRRWW